MTTRHANWAELKRRLRDLQLTCGSWLQLSSPEVAEIMCAEGFDWLVIDLEHGAIDRSAMVSLVRAIEARGVVPLARIMSCDSLMSRQALDAGCAGVIVPHVENPDTYAEFVHKSSWPPRGSRSIGFFRGNDYGLKFDAYAIEAQEPILIPMIESVVGVENVETILQTARADAVLIGPYDLSASLGVPGDFAARIFLEAVDHVLQVCEGLKIAAGVHDVKPSGESIANHAARGFTFIACGMDTVFLSQAVSQVAEIDQVLLASQVKLRARADS